MKVPLALVFVRHPFLKGRPCHRMFSRIHPALQAAIDQHCCPMGSFTWRYWGFFFFTVDSKMAVTAEGAWLVSFLRFFAVCSVCCELPAPQLLLTSELHASFFPATRSLSWPFCSQILLAHLCHLLYTTLSAF